MTLRELMENVKGYWGEYERKAVGIETFGYIRDHVSEKAYPLLYNVLKEEIPANWTVDVKAVKDCIYRMKQTSDFTKMTQGTLSLPEISEEDRTGLAEILGGRSLMEAVAEEAKKNRG